MSNNSPSSSTPEDVPRVLARNTACLPCRQRKLKCDAIRPICANCSKPRVRSGGKTTQCVWDDRTGGPAIAAPSRKKKDRETRTSEEDETMASKKAKLHDLEERVAAFEERLRAQNQSSSSSLPEIGNPPRDTERDRHGEIHAPALRNRMWEFNEGVFPGPGGYRNQPGVLEMMDQSETQTHSANRHRDGLIATSTLPDLERPSSFNRQQGVIWPDWPKDLPSLEVVEHVVEIFFDKVSTIPKMLHRATFTSSLMLPPSHMDFPAQSLLHAILSITTPHLPPSVLASNAYFPTGSAATDTVHPERDFEPATTTYRNLSSSFHPKNVASAATPSGRFQMWHRRKALEKQSQCFDTGQRLLGAVQAQCVIAILDCYNAWWTDVWMESGACMRMAVPLKLNESSKSSADKLARFQHLLIPEASSALEQAQRDRTFWMVYVTERMAVMSTCWPESLADEEITVELPVTQRQYESGVGELCGSQTLQSKDFFSYHPPEHVDGFTLLIKSIRLYTDVNRFFRHYTRGPHSVSSYVSDPRLRLHLSQINAFRMSLPAEMRKPTQFSSSQGQQKALDTDLIASIMVTHAAALELGEPMITKDLYHCDLAKMGLSAIRAILSLIYDITATTFDLSLLPSVCSFVWCLCGRALVRFMDAATLAGDSVSAGVFRSELDVFRLALSQHGERYPIALRHKKMIDDILAAAEESHTDTQQATIDCIKDQLLSGDFVAKRFETLDSSGASVSNTPSGSNSGISSFTPPGSTYSSIPATISSSSSNAYNMYPHLIGSDGRPSLQPYSNERYSPTSQPVKQQPNIGAVIEDDSLAWMNDLGIDAQNWFDISSFSFDASAMSAMSVMANDVGAMFNGPDFAMAMGR